MFKTAGTIFAAVAIGTVAIAWSHTKSRPRSPLPSPRQSHPKRLC